MNNLKAIIEEIVEAFGKRDIDAIAKHIGDEFHWLESDGTTVSQGRDQFIQIVHEYYAENPEVKNTSSEIIVLGNLATHTETFTHHADGSTRSYLWVYEFNTAGKLVKQWGYTPASVA